MSNEHKLTLGFSPCPNDTFIFDALVNGRIDTSPYRFEVIMEDVETLNRWALKGKLDITKLSFPAFFESSDKYILLTSGSALGKGVGPLLVGLTDNNLSYDHMVALPGQHTTANLLFDFAYPLHTRKEYMVFSSIEEAVLSGKTDTGVIIHENRFTYQQKGLVKIKDLGEHWENEMKIPVPLGGIATRRESPVGQRRIINGLIRSSIEYAFERYPILSSYVTENAQSMEEQVMRKHIELYVNDYSIELGEEGKSAIKKLHEIFSRNHVARVEEQELFL